MELLDTTEAAARLRLARQTLAKYRVHGGGPLFIRLGAKIVYRSADLDAWVESHGRRRSTSDVPVTAEAA